MNKKKVSIIIPVYNVEKYIEKSLKSICEQDYDNLQIILVLNVLLLLLMQSVLIMISMYL